METPENPRAYPSAAIDDKYGGMTLRDKFAGDAVIGLLASEWDRFDGAGRRIGGASVRAAGWRELWRVKGRSWDTPGRPRTDKHPTEDKVAVGWGAWPSRETETETEGA